MTWQANLRQAAYISPSGIRSVFHYENVSLEFDKKTSGFDFPVFNGTQVQDQGRSGRRYPLRCFFWGDDYLADSLQFENTLEERGIGRLEHPLYGKINVVPFGSIGRRDDLKTAANQSVIEITFWETIVDLFGGSIRDLKNSIIESNANFNNAAAGQFESEVDIRRVFEREAFKGFHRSLFDAATNLLKDFAGTDSKISTQFKQVGDSVRSDLESENELDLSILATQTNIYTQLPAKASTIEIQDRLNNYLELITPLIDPDTIKDPGLDNKISNDFHSRDLFIASYISAMSLSTINYIFQTKPQALNAADQILTIFNLWVNWRDDNYKILNKIDTGSLYSALQENITVTLQYLVTISFSLQTERTLILTKPRSIIDLIAELYKDEVDTYIDFFLQSNNLTGSEILELPAGKKIVYYL